MGFLNDILGRPRHHKPYLLLAVGFPAKYAKVPIITKKPFDQFVDWR